MSNQGISVTEQFQWYAVMEADEQLLQGDFVESCPVVIPSSQQLTGTDAHIDADVREYNTVVMSQSCDLEQQKLDLVLVCPVWPLTEFENANESYKSGKAKEQLRRGNSAGYHLLNKCDVAGFTRDYLVVDFRNVYGVPFNFLLDLAKDRGKRLRLLPPYREHLSQAFARFFMRVGLPVDIPSFI